MLNAPPLLKEFAEPHTMRGWKNMVENNHSALLGLILHLLLPTLRDNRKSKTDLCSELQQH